MLGSVALSKKYRSFPAAGMCVGMTEIHNSSHTSDGTKKRPIVVVTFSTTIRLWLTRQYLDTWWRMGGGAVTKVTFMIKCNAPDQVFG